MKRLRSLLLGFSVSWLLLGAPADAAVSEYALKAALLLKVARFVDWPATAFESPDAPLNMCLLGKDRFGADLDSIASQTVHSRAIAVHRLREIAALESRCHVVYISDSERKRLSHILARLNGRPVLTVADMEGFAALGGVMTFVTVDNHIRFEINPAVSDRAGLRLSAQLMQLATIVETETGES